MHRCETIIYNIIYIIKLVITIISRSSFHNRISIKPYNILFMCLYFFFFFDDDRYLSIILMFLLFLHFEPTLFHQTENLKRG